jgi:hypothetical protein
MPVPFFPRGLKVGPPARRPLENAFYKLIRNTNGAMVNKT